MAAQIVSEVDRACWTLTETVSTNALGFHLLKTAIQRAERLLTLRVDESLRGLGRYERRIAR